VTARVRRRLATAAGVASVAVLVLAPPAQGAATAPVYDADGNLVETPFVPPPVEPLLDEERAVELVLANEKVADWVERYDGRLTDSGDFDEERRTWQV
jgi:hypothetical protein